MMIHRNFYNDKVEEWFSNPPIFSVRNKKGEMTWRGHLFPLPHYLAGPPVNYLILETGLFDSANGSKKSVA